MISLGEVFSQYIPCPTHSLQRQIICLTNRGVHILTKNRPIDTLCRMLDHDDCLNRTDVRDFFVLYGVVESCCMCLALMCGVPSGCEERGSEGGDVRVARTENTGGTTR